MSESESRGESGRAGEVTTKPEPPGVPPPDEPLLRHEETGEAALESKEMAEKRIEALKRSRPAPPAGEKR